MGGEENFQEKTKTQRNQKKKKKKKRTKRHQKKEEDNENNDDVDIMLDSKKNQIKINTNNKHLVMTHIIWLVLIENFPLIITTYVLCLHA